MFDKLPLAERLNYFNSQETPLCQTCLTQVETQQHLYQCMESKCRKHRLSCWVTHSKAMLKQGHTSRIIMDVIDSNVRHYLKLPNRPNRWQNFQGNRAVFASVQRAIVDQNRIGWDKFLSGILSQSWESAQLLYQEISGDYPTRRPRTWAEGILGHLWEFSHNIWLYRNAIKHGVTMDEQRKARRARVVALVTDRYQYRPHLDRKYKFLYSKPLHRRLEEGNRSLYAWLTSVANLSSLFTSPATRQQSIEQHATFTRLSDTQLGRLRRPLRRLRRLSDLGGNPSPCVRSKYALGVSAPSGSQLLTSLWQFTAVTPPTPLIKPTGRKKVFHTSIQSKQAKLVWDRGRRFRMMT